MRDILRWTIHWLSSVFVPVTPIVDLNLRDRADTLSLRDRPDTLTLGDI